MKFVYLAHSEMSVRCLEGLIRRNYIPALAVISVKPGAMDEFKKTMKDICEENGIRLVNVCQSCEEDELTTMDNVTQLKGMIDDFDFGLCVGFMKILPEEVFTAPAMGMLNIHCGKLPAYRGRAPISRTIIDGNDEVVITVHRIDSGVDSGDIFLEEKISITDEDDVNTIYEACCEVSGEVASKAIENLMNGNVNFRKQESDLPAREKISELERRIEWEEDPRAVFNKIRAITFPYPGAKTFCGDKEYIVLTSAVHKTEGRSEDLPGTIIDVSDKQLKVVAGKGEIILKDLFRNGTLVKKLGDEFKTGDRFQ